MQRNVHIRWEFAASIKSDSRVWSKSLSGNHFALASVGLLARISETQGTINDIVHLPTAR